MTRHHPKKPKRERKLPVSQLTILAICRFAEPIASTSLAPYVPEMVRSFGIAEKDVGGWAGLCSAVFSLTQALVGVPWGRFSDIHGRKISILLGLASTMITSLVWGFSTNLPMAIAARAVAGAGNGNVGIIRTTVAEMVPFKELQPRAFSLMPLVWNIGSIFGPSIGGMLANPLDVKPGERIENPSFFQRFPYALPNLVSACLFAVGIVTGFLFLEETLSTLAGKRDIGLRTGDKLKAGVRKTFGRLKDRLTGKGHGKDDPDETEPLLKPIHQEDGLPTDASPPSPPPPPPSFREVITRQAALNLTVYTLLAMHSMAYDSLLPVYMGYAAIRTHSPDITAPDPTNPLRFFGGFSLSHFTIGILMTSYGVFGMLVQFFIFPPVARYFGVLPCLRVVACLFPISYILMPFTALLPTQKAQVVACFILMLLKCLAGIFAFPTSTILITNSASSLRTLGTLNGFATSFSALGRAFGPASAGAVFNLGAKRGYVIAPWWLIALISIIGAIPTFWLVEGEGFGGDDEVSDDEEDSADEEPNPALPSVLQTIALEAQVSSTGQTDAVAPAAAAATALSLDQHIENEEAAYGQVGTLLSRTATTASSAAISDVDASEPPPSSSLLQRESTFSTLGRENTFSQQQDASERPTLSRRSSRRVTRKISIPMGMGERGISRRYSSNLGQSLGSQRGSFGGGE